MFLFAGLLRAIESVRLEEEPGTELQFRSFPGPKPGDTERGGKVKVSSLMLADFASAVGNKLYICGGGWSITGPGPVPSAIAVDLKIPWDRRGETHTLRFELFDSDGQPVLVPTPQGVQPLWIQGEIQVGDVDPAVKPGMPLDAAFAVVLGPILLAPGGRYVWQLNHQRRDARGLARRFQHARRDRRGSVGDGYLTSRRVGRRRPCGSSSFTDGGCCVPGATATGGTASPEYAVIWKRIMRASSPGTGRIPTWSEV